jgi:RNA polymerase sigma-70 factor (ECF subfamily)
MRRWLLGTRDAHELYRKALEEAAKSFRRGRAFGHSVLIAAGMHGRSRIRYLRGMEGDDGELLELWRKGDRKAGATLFDRHYAAVERFFRNKVDEAAVPDLIQSAFLACVEGRERLRGDNGFRAYLFGVAHNQLCKHYRARRAGGGEAVDFDEVSVADLSPTMSVILAARQEQRLLLEALRRIPIDCQEVLELHYWEHLDTAEIAQIVGVPIGRMGGGCSCWPRTRAAA